MHIVLVTPFPRDAEHIDVGIASISKYFADEIAEISGNKVTIIVPGGVKGDSIWETWDKYRVCRVGIKKAWSFLPGTFYDMAVGKRYLNLILRHVKPDIVHYQGLAFLAAGCEFPHVLTIHGIAERDALWGENPIRKIFKWMLLRLTEYYSRKRIPHFFLISPYVREHLPQKNRIRKMWPIENPVNDSYFNVPWHYERGRLFCCASIIERKNTYGLIQAFVKIAAKFPYAQLRLSGGGGSDTAYVKKCKDLVAKFSLAGKVHFLGNLSVRELQTELSKANCLVLPSFQETAPLAIAEAMAIGVPVVASRICGVPYMVEEKKTGLLIDPFDSDSIAEAVINILSDEELAHSMHDRAKEASKKRFSLSIFSQQTLTAYMDITSHS